MEIDNIDDDDDDTNNNSMKLTKLLTDKMVQHLKSICNGNQQSRLNS